MPNSEQEVKDILDKIQKPNIAVIGQTGVGKSTLISTVFQSPQLASSGAGKPVTLEFSKYTFPNAPIVIYDSPGYEAGNEKFFIQETFEFLDQKKRKNVEEQIHLIWYIVSSSGARFTGFDKKIITKIFQDKIPVIIVLSQCDRASLEEVNGIKEEISDFIKKDNLKIYNILETSSFYLKNRQAIQEPSGVRELIDTTICLLPEIYSEAVLVAQMVNIEAKRTIAWQYISKAALACWSISAIPVSGTAITSVLSASVYLYKELLVLYGYGRWNLAYGAAGVTFGGVVSFITTAFLDIIPIPGTEIIAGTVAGGYIVVAGLAYASACEKLAIQQISGGENQIKAELKKNFTTQFNYYYNMPISSWDDVLNIGKRWKKGEI